MMRKLIATSPKRTLSSCQLQIVESLMPKCKLLDNSCKRLIFSASKPRLAGESVAHMSPNKIKQKIQWRAEMSFSIEEAFMRICGDRLLRVRLVLRLRLLRRLRRLRRPLEPATSGASSPSQSAKLKAALHARKTEAMPCNNDPMQWYVTLKIERDTSHIMFDPKSMRKLNRFKS